MADKKNEKLKADDKREQENAPKDSPKPKAKKSKSAKKSNVDEQLESLQIKIDEMNDKYLRLYSEYDNFRKRTAREKIELNLHASEETISSLLPVMDDFERALKSFEDSGDEENHQKEGILLIYNKLNGILKQKGLEVIESIGAEFSVDYHDAITKIPAPSEDMKGKVVDEIEKGYLLNGKVIRYAKVVIGS